MVNEPNRPPRSSLRTATWEPSASAARSATWWSTTSVAARSTLRPCRSSTDASSSSRAREIGELGGDDFDQLIFDFSLREAGIDPHSLSYVEKNRLLELCREAKEALTPASRRMLIDLGRVAAARGVESRSIWPSSTRRPDR